MSEGQTGQIVSVSPHDGQWVKLLEGMATDEVQLKTRANLIHSGDTCENLYYLRSGWVYRYQLLSDGRKQIFCFFTAGDLVSPSLLFSAYSHYSVATLVAGTALVIHRDALLTAMTHEPVAMTAIMKMMAYWQRYMDERMVELGRLTAYERMCVLICRLANRLSPTNHVIKVPLTRDLISDALGITPVHVSRTLKVLEDENAVCWTRQGLEILDLDKIRAAVPRNFMVHGTEQPFLL